MSSRTTATSVSARLGDSLSLGGALFYCTDCCSLTHSTITWSTIMTNQESRADHLAFPRLHVSLGIYPAYSISVFHVKALGFVRLLLWRTELAAASGPVT